MNPVPFQMSNLLGCDFVDSALASLSDLWEQHTAALQTSIIEISNRELRRSETPSHLATPSGKRKRRFTSAQKAIQALLNLASTTTSTTTSATASANSSFSPSLGKVARVTRARAKKGGVQDTSSNSSFEQGKRKGKGKAKKDEDGFVKPVEPISKPEQQISQPRPSSSSSSSLSPKSVVKKEKDEVDNKVLSSGKKMSPSLSPIPPPAVKNERKAEHNDDSDDSDQQCWNVKRTLSPPKKGKSDPPPITVTKHYEVPTPVEDNIKKQSSPEDAQPDSEWTTDEESFESIESIGDETYQRMTGKKSLNSSHKLSTVKKQQKRKQTEYFTPSIPLKSKRITRSTANKVENTPKIESLTKKNLLAKASSSVSKSSNKLMSCEKSSGTTTSGSSIASSAATISSVGRTDSMKGKRAVPRTCNTPDTKALTASAAKKRLEEEEKRKATLAQMKEKEEKAIQSKQENLKMKAQLTKMKNDEKRKKIEQIRKKEEEELKEKRQREQSKLEEIEKRRKEKEEARRREILRNQEAAKRKQIEFDLRKQQEEEERKARILKQEEQNRQRREENERIRIEQEKILRMIAQHNSNLQKGQNTSATQQKVDQPAVAQFKQPLPPTSTEAQPALPMNRTFSVDKEELVKKEETPPIKVESYQLTPPPKPKPTPVNYDISDIKSDDDTDDEERPRKQIPSWAKGDALIAALDKQFAKSRRARERQIREIFPCYDFSIQLTDIFKSSRVVHPKYDKRTSSAVWSSPPCNSTFNCSMLTDDL